MNTELKNYLNALLGFGRGLRLEYAVVCLMTISLKIPGRQHEKLTEIPYR